MKTLLILLALVTQPVFAATNLRPVAHATAVQVQGGMAVDFDGSASYDPDGEVTAYVWSFGDGETGAQVTTRHTYELPGTYTASLTAWDNSTVGETDEVSFTVVVVAPVINQPPVARATAAAVDGSLSVDFDGGASSDPDGQVTDYRWRFGDGATGSGAQVHHTYAASGTYTATLTVTDNSGEGSAISRQVTVQRITPMVPNPAPWVTGYYAGWFWSEYPPQNVDMSAMTHVVFGRVAPGGGTLGGAPGEVMFGAGTAGEAGQLGALTNKSVEDYLIERAHAAGTKALLMLGGVSDGGGFLASTNAANRPAFIANLINYLAKHGYDGLDVDWEEQLDTEVSQSQLIAFVTELRAAAAAHPRYQSPNKPILITFPSYAMNMNIDTVPEWKVTVAALVDQYNLMSYALSFDAPGWATWHFCAIAGEDPTHPTDLTSSVQAYVNAGVDRNKVGIGIGFYGMGFALPATGPGLPAVPTEPNDVQWSYANLVRSGYLSHGTYHWDSTAKMGYRSYAGGYTGTIPLYQASVSGYVSYEDPASISAKGAWVRATGVGGTILWVINYGSPDGVHNPLLSAVKQAFLAGDAAPAPFALLTTAQLPGTRTVAFDASASVDASHAAVASYTWDFGDQHTGSGLNPGHTYATDGVYNVTLTVTDAAGRSGATTVSLTVQGLLPTGVGR